MHHYPGRHIQPWGLRINFFEMRMCVLDRTGFRGLVRQVSVRFDISGEYGVLGNGVAFQHT